MLLKLCWLCFRWLFRFEVLSLVICFPSHGTCLEQFFPNTQRAIFWETVYNYGTLTALERSTDCSSFRYCVGVGALHFKKQQQKKTTTIDTSVRTKMHTYSMFPQCLQHLDVSVLGELVPRLCELLKSGVGLGTKVLAHFSQKFHLKSSRDFFS